MDKKKMCIIALIAILTISFISSCAAPAPAPAPTPAPAAPQVTTWKYVTCNLPGEIHNTIEQELTDAIEQASVGQLEIEFYCLGELPYEAGDYLRALQDGLIQMAEIDHIPTSADIPMMLLRTIGYVATTRQELETIEAIAIRYIEAELDEWNVVPIAWLDYGFRQVLAKKPLSGLEDLKGMKIRVKGGLETSIVEAWDANPVTVGWGEVYTAAQRGVIDGLMTATLAMKTTNLDEVCHYYLKVDANKASTAIFINKDAFYALPEHLQQSILAMGKIWQWKFNEQIMYNLDETALGEMIERGGVKEWAEITVEEKAATRDKLMPALRAFIEERIGDDGIKAYEEMLAAIR